MTSPYLMYVTAEEYEAKRSSALNEAMVALQLQRDQILRDVLGPKWEQTRVAPEVLRRMLGNKASNFDRLGAAILGIKDALDLKVKQ